MHLGNCTYWKSPKGKHDTKEHYEEKYSTEETREPKAKKQVKDLIPKQRSHIQNYKNIMNPWFTEHHINLVEEEWFD